MLRDFDGARHMERLSTMKATGGVPDDKLDNELCIAFWTCLQLER
jgi:hypothetical protein